MRNKRDLVSMTPDMALQKLMEGNLRFRTNQQVERNLMNEVVRTAAKQLPFAIVLGCIDSRVPLELLFDQGVGDLFVARVAGNFENDDILASMEFACNIVGSKIIMVLGHESCGAVKAACDDVQMGYITGLLGKIKPAIVQANIKGDLSSKNKKAVNTIAKTNVQLTIQRIREKSTILNQMEKSGAIKIVGAYYKVKSGKVSLL